MVLAARGASPGPRGGVAPWTPSRCGYQSWESDQLRRLGAAAGMECLPEALGVGVGRETVVVDA